MALKAVEPLVTLPIGGKNYPVATLTAEALRARVVDAGIIVRALPMSRDAMLAYARIALALARGASPELNPDLVSTWLSPALRAAVAGEFDRQFRDRFGRGAFPGRP